jgi:DNA modification methylase
MKMNFNDLFNIKHDTVILEDDKGVLINADCMKVFKKLSDNFSNLTITDIPFGVVNRADNGLRNLNKGNADKMTFDLDNFLNEVYRTTSSTIIIFCGIEQVSPIAEYFYAKQKKKLGTMRHLIWKKSNPSPMNGDYMYLSGSENAIWFKKRGGTFNAHCKSNVFEYPCGRSKLHPTEKNHNLIKDLILDNSNENDIVLDPCCGSASHCYCARELSRKYVGVELDKKYFEISKERMHQ